MWSSAVSHSGEPLENSDVHVRAYLTSEGEEAEPVGVSLSRDGNRVAAAFEAPRDGVFSFGVSIEAPQIVALAPGRPSYSAASLSKPIVLRYPYDWTWRGKRNVLNARPRLVMPGIEAGGRVILADTHELFSVQLVRVSEARVRALLLKHRVHNDGGDVATADLRLRAGQQHRLDVLSFDNIAEANRARFGTAAPMKGRATQPAYRGWTSAGLTEEHYGKIAGGLKGTFDYVIVREVQCHDWLPPIFHAQGIRAFSYQYLGALRRHSSQVSKAIERQMGMRDAVGGLYTAPRSPDGAWLLCDIRRPEVRRVFVQNASRAIRAGFDGVFLDGYPFWTDATGRRGGNAPDATCSLAYARWLLLREIRNAIREANPHARLGVLGNQYCDSLGEGDFIVKERMYFGWDDFARQFDQRRTLVMRNLDVPFEEGQAPYAAKSIMYGVKGYSPISVQTCLHFLRRPTGLVYVGLGDFFPDRLDDWLSALLAVTTQNDLYLTAIDPRSCRIHFAGRDTMWAEAACVVQLSVPACAVAENHDGEHRHQIRQFRMAAEERYRVLRECPSVSGN